MKAEKSDQSIDRLFKYKKLNLSNFMMVQKVCDMALKNSDFFSIVGDTGSGKTVALEHFRDSKPDQVKLMTVRPTMNITDFFLELGRLFGYRGPRKNKYNMSNYIKEYCNTIEHKEVLLIDEAARFKPNQFTFLQEIRDNTKSSLGIVISGPHDFLKKLLSWDDEGVMGVAEFKRRIQLFIRMKSLEKKEIIAVCTEYGIKEAEIITKEFLKYNNIAALSRAVKNHLKYKNEVKGI